MKFLWILFLSFSILNCSYGQPVVKKAGQSFPVSWVGNWKGTLQWYQQGKKEAETITMELHIQPADSSGYTWNLIYGSGEKKTPYILKPVDSIGGHWVIDELNGIVIDQYFIGNKLFGAFTVRDATIINHYSMEKENLVVEFLTYAAKPVSTSGKGTEQVPFTESHGIKSYQYAVLKRVQ